jgi:hypothetical protein
MDLGPCRVMEDIDNYNKLGGMKKQLADTAMQIYTINQISARQHDAIHFHEVAIVRNDR